MPMTNLLPWRQSRRQYRMRRLVCALVIQFAATSIVLFAMRLQFRQQQHVLRQLIVQISDGQRQYAGLSLQAEDLRRQVLAHQALLDLKRQNQQRNQRYLTLLEQLPRVIPDVIWLTSISDSDAAIRLSGVSNHYSSVVEFSKKLAGLPVVTVAELQEAQRDHSDASRLQFSLRLYWKPVTDAERQQ
ncbi:PilN domain-containing protein [Musicola keenii]|uniref:PilN domain-containing protein n=1 Tax=Musicola keenii TaxID=2884250 RepID=UPI001785F424|nr:PilN domain-containing protein [Musicola keenii]